jgi:uncharacterized membrane protein
MRFENELQIDAPVPVVWQLTVDVEGWPQTTPTTTSVERLDTGPIQVGSRARVKQPGQRAAIWTVTALEPECLYRWETMVFGLRMVGRHELAPVGGGTHNALSLELEGRGSGLFGRLIGRKILESITTENAGFKRRAESAARTDLT